MDEYDEYGNYLGEDLEEEEEELEEEHGNGRFVDDEEEGEEAPRENGANSTAIVLHEDKALYPSASSVFGDDVEIVMDTEEPPASNKAKPLLPKEEIIREKKRKPLEESEQDRFDNFVSSNPSLIRNVAFVGHLHSGKSSLIRMLHRKKNDNEAKAEKTVNVRADEKALKISLKLRPVTSACADSSGKSFFVQSLDTPGHVNFSDEVECALEVADGAVIVVDVVEGVQLGTELAVDALRRHRLLESTVIVLNKMDRLIHELKLPPGDAYRKIVHVIDTLEGLFRRHTAEGEDLVSPRNSRMIFASAEHGWCVSVESMALLTVPKDRAPRQDNLDKLVSLLWGNDSYYHPGTRSFSRSRTSNEHKRSFEHFVLDPIYKIYAHVLGADASTLEAALGPRLKLTKKELQMDARPLLKRVFSKLLPSATGCLVDSIVRHVPDPSVNLKNKLRTNWKGSLVPDDVGMSQGPLLVHCVKFIYPGDDPEDILDVEEEASLSFGSEVAFRVLARVYSGTLGAGNAVIVKESVGAEEEEDDTKGEEEEDDSSGRFTIRAVRMPSRGGGEPCRSVQSAGPGLLVLLSGIDSFISKSATIVAVSGRGRSPATIAGRFAQLKLFRQIRLKPTVKLAIEPLVPAELPKMLTGLRALQRSYPSLSVQVEESGEYVLLGSGELFLDSAMRDLRERFSKGTEVKVVDPFVALRETVQAQSETMVNGETPNGKCQFSLIASELEEKLVEDLESGYFSKKLQNSSLDKILKKDYGYDILASRSVWAFGPETTSGLNALVDDTLMENKDKTLYPAKEFISQGFRWAVREGPLCGEPVRGVKVKLLDATLVGMEASSAGQVMKTIKKMSHQAMLRASPSLMEPVYAFDAIVADTRALGMVRRSLEQRRGWWPDRDSLSVVPGTPLHRFRGNLPVLDSFGLETEIRLRSRGSVFPQMYFDRWQMCPGDPLDDSIALKPLEPSPPDFLARDLVIKTRRRKGMPESIEGANVLDAQVLKELATGGK